MLRTTFYLLFLFQTIVLFGANIKRDSLFNLNWKFQKGSYPGAEKPEFNDKNWRSIDLPHDWSIEDINIKDTTNGRIISGPYDSQAQGGRHSGFTIGGTGWYRKHFKIPQSDKGKVVYINFDGIYMNSDIWINGNHLANQPYGYTAFWCNLTPFLNYGDKENILAVEVKNEGENSRWYSGSGIYRNVFLAIVEKVHIKPWGVFITTPEVDSSIAVITINSEINNLTNESVDIKYQVEIFNRNSQKVAFKTVAYRLYNKVPTTIKVDIPVEQPQLWSPDTPYLYKAICTVTTNDKILDQTENSFGIRSIQFDSEKGMLLNGASIKLKGGALHANNGPLGACAFYRAEERRVELLKNLGFNAVRCGHNPPSSAFLEACDRLGLFVIDETFDVWTQGWLEDDYHKYFNEWWKHDVRNMILRDRNHPSIFTWSIGNQIREARDSTGITLAYQIANFIRTIDPTRPITANVAMEGRGYQWRDGDPEHWQDYDALFSALDICGYSYQSAQYENVHKRLPDRIQFSTEIDPRNAFTNWMRTIDNDFVIGNFTWTAMDFMGEVSLGWLVGFGMSSEELFPWTSTYSGDIDLCGFRKPRSYYRDILFKRGDKLSLFVKAPVPSFENDRNSPWGWEDVKQSWNWAGHEGDSLTVVVYSRFDSVMLMLNGNPIGSKITNRETEFKAYWTVPYSEGSLNAIGYLDGNVADTSILKTASDPYRIRLTADRNQITADKQDLSFVTVEILDKNNLLVPYANNLVKFRISGEGKLAAVGNGNPVSLESFQQSYRKAYEGKCLLIVKSTDIGGIIKIVGEGDNLIADEISIKTVK